MSEPDDSVIEQAALAKLEDLGFTVIQLKITPEMESAGFDFERWTITRPSHDDQSSREC
jgi:hypothetical protein